MISVLVDHHLKGKATHLWGVLAAGGWVELAEIRLITLTEAGLSVNSSDRTIWRFVQAQGMLLLTNNRNMKGVDSLE